MLDTKALAEATATIVREHVDKATAPLLKRIDALEDGLSKAAEVKINLDDKNLTARITEVSAGVVAAMEPKIVEKAAVDRDSLTEAVIEEVGKAVAAIPVPKDGKSVDPAELTEMVAETVQKAVEALPAPKDGVGVAGALIDRDGSLVLTLSDGTTRELGCVIGRDGQNGSNGKDGSPGRDGKDGLGFDDLSFEHDGERGFVLRFQRGDTVKEFPFKVPTVLDRGVYRPERTYSKGDAVTWAGSLWIAQNETAEKPDSGDGWRLAVKRGRDAKTPVDFDRRAL